MCLNITAGFLQSSLLKNTINESRIGVNKKRHEKADRIKVTANSEDKNNVANFKRKWTKSHIIYSLLTSFARSVRESICLRVFRKPQGKYFVVQTSLARTRFISLLVKYWEVVPTTLVSRPISRPVGLKRMIYFHPIFTDSPLHMCSIHTTQFPY